MLELTKEIINHYFYIFYLNQKNVSMHKLNTFFLTTKKIN